MKNPIFLQYIVLFPIEAWSHVKQHHQEEITQYIAYTMYTQLYMVSNLGVIYCLLSSYRDERRQYITRLINIHKSNCYISHTFIIFPYKLMNLHRNIQILLQFIVLFPLEAILLEQPCSTAPSRGNNTIYCIHNAKTKFKQLQQ